MGRRAALALLCAACASAPSTPPPAPARARADRVPDMPLSLLGGDRQTLRDLAAGRVLVVDFFATWCAPCVKGIPRLRQLQAAHPEITVVGVDLGEEPELVARFVARENVSYPVLMDRNFAFTDACGVRDIPAIFVVDGEGRIRHRGEHVDAALEAALLR
jgi:thiol-disulfide isomerase/thioredoxin